MPNKSPRWLWLPLLYLLWLFSVLCHHEDLTSSSALRSDLASKPCFSHILGIITLTPLSEQGHPHPHHDARACWLTRAAASTEGGAPSLPSQHANQPGVVMRIPREIHNPFLLWHFSSKAISRLWQWGTPGLRPPSPPSPMSPGCWDGEALGAPPCAVELPRDRHGQSKNMGLGLASSRCVSSYKHAVPWA